MKLDRITIIVEAPAGVVDHEKLLGLVKAELYGSMHGIPHQAQAWLEPSPNTHIGAAIERPTTDDYDQYEAEALRPCEKCGEPMNKHDRWNRCPVACDKCGLAMKVHGVPGGGCPFMGVAGMEVAPMNCDKCGLALKLHGVPGTPCPVRMQNYLAQARLAEAQMTVMHNKLLAEGYVETAPGILTSPDGKVVVEW